MLDALLAGIADTLADEHGLARPTWTSERRRFLTSEWRTPGTPAMARVAELATPPQLREHGIIASRDSLWRRDRPSASASASAASV